MILYAVKVLFLLLESKDSKCRPVPLHHVDGDRKTRAKVEADRRVDDVMNSIYAIDDTELVDVETQALQQLLEKPIGEFDISLSLPATDVHSDYVEFKFYSERVVFGFIVAVHRQMKWLSSYDQSIELEFSRNCYIYKKYAYSVKQSAVSAKSALFI